MAAFANPDYYPDTNMGMGGMSSTAYTPTSTRDALDRYFRAYWKQRQERAGAIEGMNIRSQIAASERSFRGSEAEKERAFKSSEQLKEQQWKTTRAAEQRGWNESDAENANKFAYLAALTNIGTLGVGLDNLYNAGGLRKAIYKTGADAFNQMGSTFKAINQKKADYGIPYTVEDPSLYGGGVMPTKISTGAIPTDPEYAY
jgi:hypothetical protein